ncbi:MAG TPA: multicopper oxidase family protein [Candidatus Polarisedimenticolia bacterium]|nr:multicopper oxidase family protein [Candidatus Polarisedimenticolia bacterium]
MLTTATRSASHDHHHAHQGVVTHAPASGTPGDYREALEQAVPDSGRRVIAVEFEAREVEGLVTPGFTAWTFNGQVPGPVLEGRVGDVLEVRLTNRLPEPTSIHWHGLRLPAPMDGTDMVQTAVAPGASFTYRFRLADAGTYWYHSHTNETVQMERGLYGALIVRGAEEPVLDGEQVLVFDDVKLDRKGRLARFGGLVQWHDGREGNVRLINGRVEPRLAIAAGQVERWRLINASSARYLRFSLGQAPFRILGTDGGLLQEPRTESEVLLAPGERADVAVGPFEEGRTLPIESQPYWRTTIKRRKTESFGSLRVGPSRPSAAMLPAFRRPVARLAPADAVPTRRVEFGVRYSLRRGMDFVVNGRRHDQDAVVKVGDLQVWDIVNSTLMDHPFHLHGFSFQVLAVDGVARASVSFEDVVNLPPRSTTRIAWMPDDRPGSWMYHCHILEHHAAGMMAHFDVVR